MSESDGQQGGIVEAPKVKQDYIVTSKAPDGSEVYVHLQENEDAAQPPTLVNVSKQPHDQPPPKATQDEETHVIISTGSGHKQATSFFDNVISPVLDTLGTKNPAVHTTQSETAILDLTRDIFFPRANRSTLLRIILLSGDGGIVDLVNGLSSQKQSPHYIAPHVILIPLGTANALYHSINTGKKKNSWGIDALVSNNAKPLPIFTATFSLGSRLLTDEARREEHLPKNDRDESVLHGAVVCSWGMHATLVADSDTTEYRKHGIDRFKMAAKDALYPSDGSAPHAYKGRVSILTQNQKWTPLPDHEHMYLLSTMVSHLEAPFCISPATKPLDGSMHLVHFGPTSGDEAMRIMGLAYQGGKHVDDLGVRYESIEGLRIDFHEEEDRWRRVCVDGKIVRVEEGGWIEVRKSAESVLDVVAAAAAAE